MKALKLTKEQIAEYYKDDFFWAIAGGNAVAIRRLSNTECVDLYSTVDGRKIDWLCIEAVRKKEYFVPIKLCKFGCKQNWPKRILKCPPYWGLKLTLK